MNTPDLRTDREPLGPAQVVMVVVVLATLAGVFLLTSGEHQRILHDGQVSWVEGSWLRAMVEVLNLQFTQTTAKGVAIKSLVFGGGVALALMVLAFALGTPPRPGTEPVETEPDSPPDPADNPSLAAELVEEGDPVHLPNPPQPRRHLTMTTAAQLLLLLFGLWSLASYWWAPAKATALGGSTLLAIQLCWAFALALVLNRSSARIVAYGLVVALVATAALTIWYYDERNPTLRASYPIGNPLFLAACLIPGILLALTMVVAAIVAWLRRTGPVAVKIVLIVVLGLIAVLVMGWAFYLTDSRGPAFGLLAGVGGLILFAMPKSRRLPVTVLLIGALVAVLAILYSQRDQYFGHRP